MPYTDSVIETSSLRAQYRGRTVFADLDLQVRPGVLALLGPNGAGKTTLVQILTTLRPADGGIATVCGIDVAADPRAVRREISAVGQSTALDGQLTGRENLRMIARLLGMRARTARVRADALLEQFGLSEAAARRVLTYSGGMKRRLDIAAALLRPSRLLFLDEPSTGMDPVSRLQLWSDLRQLANEGTSIMVTTQYLQEAANLATRVVMLSGGHIVADGTPTELSAAAGRAVVEARDRSGAIVGTYPTDASASDVRRVLDELPEDVILELRHPSLDDAYLQLLQAPDAGAPGQLHEGSAA